MGIEKPIFFPLLIASLPLWLNLFLFGRRP